MLPILFSHSSYAEHTISITTSGLETVNVITSDDGVSIAETELNITTTCKSGYNLFLSSTVDDNNLYLDGDSDYDNPNEYFTPSDGVTSLALASNAWGYYYSGENVAPSNSSVFSAVPVVGNFATIRNDSETASIGAINDTFSLYYGIKASDDLIPGYYSMKRDENEELGKVVYFATLSEDCFRYTVEYNPTGTNLGIPITGTGNVLSQYIAEGMTDNLTADVYGNPVIDDVTYYFIGWNTAQDGSGISYVSEQQVTDLVPAGESITLYAQWSDCLSGYICYHKNSNGVEGSMGKQTVLSSDTTAILLASNYSRSGYGFAGWSTARDYSDIIYGPNETISFSAGQYTDGNTGLSLYATWIESAGNIQNWNSCSELSPVSYDNTNGVLNADLSSIVALTDLRDNQTYAVARLADGNCWMIENLRLSSEYTTTESSSVLSQGYGQSEIYGDFVGLANSESNYFSDNSNSNSKYGINDSSVDINSLDYPNYRLPRYNNTNTNSRGDYPSTDNANLFSYGNYYNWSAAMANTKYYKSGFIDNDQEADKSNIANTSLCPSGWRLPYGSSVNNGPYSGNMAILDISMGGTGLPDSANSVTKKSMSDYWRRFPNNLVLSGDITGSSISIRGINGYLWTTTASGYNKSYGFSIGVSYVNPGINTYEKYYGFSVRCMVDN